MLEQSKDHAQDGAHPQGRELQPHRPPDGITESDYEAIEDAVMETARGRWFLKEYARRMRAAETQTLRNALERIEKIVSLAHAPHADAQTQLHIREQMENISERLLDITWYMRERGFSSSICTAIDKEARDLGALVTQFEQADSSAQDDEPPSPVVATTLAAETPAVVDAEVVEEVLEENPAVESVEVAVASPDQMQPALTLRSIAERMAAFAHVDALPVRQKLAMFA